ncbi:hypothetical protein EI555_011447, partial [Monodon monoceros]
KYNFQRDTSSGAQKMKPKGRGRGLSLFIPISPLTPHLNSADYGEMYRDDVHGLEERQEGGIRAATTSCSWWPRPAQGAQRHLPVCPSPLGGSIRSRGKVLPGPTHSGATGVGWHGKDNTGQKIVLDWTTGTLYPGQLDDVFYVSCREVVLLPEGRLDQLLFWRCGENQGPIIETLRQLEWLLFILDDCDELQRGPLQREMMFSNKACQVPGICCVVCSWLKGQIERGREVLEMPGNCTDIFMAYVSTFLPHSAPGVCSELTRDKVLRDSTATKRDLTSRSTAFTALAYRNFFMPCPTWWKRTGASWRGGECCREVNRLLDEKKQTGGEAMALRMQFLLDISKKEGSSNWELKFCLKISPSIKQDLKCLKERMDSIKHFRTWDLEFSLYESKVKGLIKGVQMSDVSFKMEHFQKEKKCPIVGKSNRAGIQKSTSNGKGRGTEELETRRLGATGRGAEKGPQGLCRHRKPTPTQQLLQKADAASDPQCPFL